MNKFDNNGQGLKLLFQGNKMFTTKLGGAIHLIVYLIMVVYGSQKLIKLYTYDDPDITTTKKFIPADQTDAVQLGEYGFDLLALVQYIHPKTGWTAMNVPKSIGSFSMKSVQINNYTTPSINFIPKVDCEKTFPNVFGDVLNHIRNKESFKPL